MKANYNPADRIFCRGGRTGQKVHKAHPGSSVLDCGHWLKGAASYFKVSNASPESQEKFKGRLCEKCFGENAND